MVSSQTWYTVAKYGLGITAAVPMVLTTVLWWFQRSLIYASNIPKGSRQYVPLPTDVGLPFEDVTLTTSDGVKIKGYVIPARRRIVPLEHIRSMNDDQRRMLGMLETHHWEEAKHTIDAKEYVRSRPTVIMFQSNAGNIGHRVPMARKFVSELECNVFMLSYRGYGHSEGKASQRGIQLDVAAMMEYLSTHPLLKDTQLVIYGQSIGGAVCLDTAAAFPRVSGVVVENSFVSLPLLVPHVLPLVPRWLINLLLIDRWDATKTLPKIKRDTPVLFLSGSYDELVPQSHMIQLRDMRAAHKGKLRWREFPGTHNDTYLCAEYWNEIAKWIRDEVVVNEKRASSIE